MTQQDAVLGQSGRTKSNKSVLGEGDGIVESARSCSLDAENVSLLKLVVLAILIALLWKLAFFIKYALMNGAIPLVDPFFPALFRSQYVVRVAYIATCCAGVLLLFCSSQKLMVLLAAIMLVCLSVLSIHQLSYNDVTFFCCAWAALWCLWMSTRLTEPISSLFPRAAWLTHLILSMIFIGGAVGKLTEGYWSGEILYEIYFIGRDFWAYNLLRENFSAESLRNAATWHSRMVIIGEFACGFLWMLPTRAASFAAIAMLCGIALTNNILLFSVVTSLLGLALVGLHQSPKNRKSRKWATDAAGADADADEAETDGTDTAT